jgi:hypothetical protein
MGYTHYFRNPKGFTDAQWDNFVSKVKDIFAKTKIPLGNAYGEEGSSPAVDHLRVSFNGIGEDSCETCIILKTPQRFEFTKTRQRPYDQVVVDVYKAAREANPSIELSSDGGEQVFGS